MSSHLPNEYQTVLLTPPFGWWSHVPKFSPVPKFSANHDSSLGLPYRYRATWVSFRDVYSSSSRDYLEGSWAAICLRHLLGVVLPTRGPLHPELWYIWYFYRLRAQVRDLWGRSEDKHMCKSSKHTFAKEGNRFKNSHSPRLDPGAQAKHREFCWGTHTGFIYVKFSPRQRVGRANVLVIWDLWAQCILDHGVE